MIEKEFTLKYPVYTLDKRELLPAGTVLTEGVLNELTLAGKDIAHKSQGLLEYGTIKKDMLDFLSQPPYDVIFSDRERIASIFEPVAHLRLMLPVLESMDYFKEKEFYTYRHMLLVFALSIFLGQELMKENLNLMNGALASPSHDFGKICVPLEILKKANPLTRTERQVLEHHTLAGFVLLTYYNDRKLSVKIARDHHERCNGSGYPRGVSLHDSLVEIVMVSDIYDALISPRPYRPTNYDNRTALDTICGMAEKGDLSWNIVKALIACNRKDKPHYSQCTVAKEKRGTPPDDNLYGITV